MQGRETSGALDALRIARIDPGPVGERVWKDAVALPSFRSLLGLKRGTIIPLMVLSLTFFFGTTLFYGFGRDLMGKPLIESLNVGYVLIFATYLVCWIVALLYFVIATYWFDPRAAKALADNEREGGLS